MTLLVTVMTYLIGIGVAGAIIWELVKPIYDDIMEKRKKRGKIINV